MGFLASLYYDWPIAMAEAHGAQVSPWFVSSCLRENENDAMSFRVKLRPGRLVCNQLHCVDLAAISCSLYRTHGAIKQADVLVLFGKPPLWQGEA